MRLPTVLYLLGMLFLGLSIETKKQIIRFLRVSSQCTIKI